MADKEQNQEISNAMAPAIETTDQSQSETPQERLTDLTARATALYAIKKYEEAAELYSEATEIQAELSGEMAEDNADLLFSYGRCLFYVAQKTSTVLGGTAASAQLKGSDKKQTKKRKANGTIKAESSSSAAGPGTSLEPVTETAEPADVVPAVDVEPEATKAATSEQPFFRIEGDSADWADSEEEDEEPQVENEEDGGEDEEEEDDFNTAYEILDLSRVLYTRKLASKESSDPQSDNATSDIRSIKTKVADIYDLQAEINLEGEKFSAAVTDLQSCLKYRQELLAQDDNILAECHYKLSLALEAACQIQQRDADGNPVGEISIDWNMRNEAVEHQQKAIESCQLRITKEQADMEKLPQDKIKERVKAKEQIEDAQDIVQAMQQRLEELKKPPVSVKAEAEKDAMQELKGSVLGQMLGAGSGNISKDQQKAKLAEVIASANDLSGMVKRKKPKTASPDTANAVTTQKTETVAVVNGKGKRKAEDVESETTNGQTETVKKVRIEDVVD